MAVGDDKMEGSVSYLSLDNLEYNRSGDVPSSEDLAWAESCPTLDSILMAFGDDMMEGSVSSLNLDNLEYDRSGDVPSSEDLAWAESCLIKDPDLSETNWDSMRDCLLDTLSYQFTSIDSSLGGRNANPRVLPSEETKTSESLQRAIDHRIPPTDDVTDGDSDDHLNMPWSRNNLENVFLPTYNEEVGRMLISDSKVDPVFPGFLTEEEPSTDTIFKVWDLGLGILGEEAELTEQVKKALSESSLQPTPSTVDDLIAELGDLSLNQDDVSI